MGADMRALIIFVLTATLTACAAMQPVSSIDASDRLRPGEEIRTVKKPSETMVYVDNTVDYRKYRKFLVEPVVIYQGADDDFGSIPGKDRQWMADYIRESFVTAITANDGYPVVNSPGPDVVRVKFTLIGMTRTIRTLQAVTLINPVGLGINTIKSLSGGQGAFMGNVTIAAEFYDSQSGRLISAFQAKRYPLPIDVLNLAGEYDAAQAGVRDIMQAIRRGADATHRP